MTSSLSLRLAPMLNSRGAYKKVDLWAICYFDPDSHTFGNATQSAIRAYNHDPITQYNLASVVGSRNLKKYKVLARTELELQGFTFAHLIYMGYSKVKQGDFDDWLKFMKFLGYCD